MNRVFSMTEFGGPAAGSLQREVDKKLSSTNVAMDRMIEQNQCHRHSNW
jgi:hypothetical protein